jgi:agmatinase
LKIRTGYGDLPSQFTSLNNSEIAILPVPYDKTSTWIKGSDKGPDAIIEASANIELYDIETDTEVYKKGIHTLDSIVEPNSESMVVSVYNSVKKLLDLKKFVITLGGEHTVSIGAIQACNEIYKNMSVLQHYQFFGPRPVKTNDRLS